MSFADFANSAMTLPWGVRAAIGHALPLLVSMYCLWSLRGYARTAAVLPFLAATAASGLLLWTTADVVVGPADGIAFGIKLVQAVPVMLALVVASMAAGRVDWRAAFAGAFFPLYVVDFLVSRQVADTDFDAFLGLGFAGPFDGLLVTPLLAVAMTWCVGRHR